MEELKKTRNQEFWKICLIFGNFPYQTTSWDFILFFSKL